MYNGSEKIASPGPGSPQREKIYLEAGPVSPWPEATSSSTAPDFPRPLPLLDNPKLRTYDRPTRGL